MLHVKYLFHAALKQGALYGLPGVENEMNRSVTDPG